MGMKISKEIPFRFDEYIRALSKNFDKQDKQLLNAYILCGKKNENYIQKKKEEKCFNNTNSKYTIKKVNRKAIQQKVSVKSKVMELIEGSPDYPEVKARHGHSLDQNIPHLVKDQAG